jgi:hypothetical protein
MTSWLPARRTGWTLIALLLLIGLVVGAAIVVPSDDAAEDSLQRVQLETCGRHGATGFVVNDGLNEVVAVVAVDFQTASGELIQAGRETVRLGPGEIAEWLVSFEPDLSEWSESDISGCEVSVDVADEDDA